METFDIALSKSWIPESYLHWIFGDAHGTLLSTIFMSRWKFELVLYSSSIEEISNKLFNGFQSNSSYRRIFWHSWNSLPVRACVTIPKSDPSIFIGMNRSSDASNTSFLRGLVGSLYIWTPNFRNWLGFISDFSILFPNHKPCPNSSISTSPE